MASTGFFVTCDTVGRNGHLRWPEALSIVHEYWKELPKEYTYNHLLRRHEALYENWDCSVDGFEGIRAQDLLPLLLQHFHFDFFLPFGNLIDPFIDRAFGHNFKPERTWDIAFIDRVHRRDDFEIKRGAIKPTHIIAAMSASPVDKTSMEEGLDPVFCVRWPSLAPIARRDMQLAATKAKRLRTNHTQSGLGRLGERGECTLEIIPPTPRKFEQVVARVCVLPEGAADMDSLRLRQDSGILHIEIDEVEECGSIPRGVVTVDISLGQLAPGNYDVSLDTPFRCGVATRSFSVETQVAKSSRGPLVDYTDLWWDPNDAGWGISIHQHASGLLVATWLTFDVDDNPVWYSLQPGKWIGTATFDGSIYVTHRCARPLARDSEKAVSERVGAGTLAFEDYANGTFSCVLSETAHTRTITRMAY